MTDPEFYRVRLAKGAAWVPLKIWFGHPTDPVTHEILGERPATWRAVRNGKDEAIEDCVIEMMGGYGLMALPCVGGECITETEYNYLTELNAHCRVHELESYEANPRKAIDMNKIAPIPW